MELVCRRRGAYVIRVCCAGALFALAVSSPLLAQAPAKLQLRGQVVDDQGHPVKGAIIRGVTESTVRQGQQVTGAQVAIPERTTNERGEFTIEVNAADPGPVVYL